MPETSHDGASSKVSGFSQVHLQKVGIRGLDDDVAGLEGWLYLQHEAIPQHFSKKGKQKVRVVVHHHRMSVLKDDGTSIKHLIELTKTHGQPQPGQSNMFHLHSAAFDQHVAGGHETIHHEAHDLFFIASSESGRDQWLEALQERGMQRLDYAPTCDDHHFLFRKKLSYYQSITCNRCEKQLTGEQQKLRKELEAHSAQLFPMLRTGSHLRKFYDKVLDAAGRRGGEEKRDIIGSILNMDEVKDKTTTETDERGKQKVITMTGS